MTIYFIAVNYNNSHHTLDYVRSVRDLNKSDLYNTQTIIVDNHSSEEDYDILCKGIKNEQVKIIRAEENLGYFKGLNLGLKQVNLKQPLFVVIGNNDLHFEKDFAIQLLNTNFDQQTMVLAPDVVTINGFHQNPMVADRMPAIRRWGLKFYFSNYYLGKAIYAVISRVKHTIIRNKKLEQQRFIYMGIGACYVLTENFFRHFDKLDDYVFLWSEEAMLRGQLNRIGGKMLYCPELIVHHHESVTVNKMPSRKVWNIASQSFKKNYRHY